MCWDIYRDDYRAMPTQLSRTLTGGRRFGEQFHVGIRIKLVYNMAIRHKTIPDNQPLWEERAMQAIATSLSPTCGTLSRAS